MTSLVQEKVQELVTTIFVEEVDEYRAICECIAYILELQQEIHREIEENQ